MVQTALDRALARSLLHPLIELLYVLGEECFDFRAFAGSEKIRQVVTATRSKSSDAFAFAFACACANERLRGKTVLLGEILYTDLLSSNFIFI
jgi:hypothetical protein